MQTKKNEFYNREQKTISEWVEEKEMSKIWNYIRKINRTPLTGKGPNNETWIKFYKNLFNNFNVNETKLNYELTISENPELDDPFKLEEVRMMINKIKKKEITRDGWNSSEYLESIRRK